MNSPQNLNTGIFYGQFHGGHYIFPLFLSISNADSFDRKDYGVDSIIKMVTEHKHLGSGSISRSNMRETEYNSKINLYIIE